MLDIFFPLDCTVDEPAAEWQSPCFPFNKKLPHPLRGFRFRLTAAVCPLVACQLVAIYIVVLIPSSGVDRLLMGEDFMAGYRRPWFR